MGDRRSDMDLAQFKGAQPSPSGPMQSGPYPPEVPQEVVNIVKEGCVPQVILGTFAGGVMGAALGLFLGALGSDPGMQFHTSGKDLPSAPVWDQMRVSWRATGKRAIGMGQNFAVITAIFQGTECVVEKYRGKHDVMNSMISGCAAGAALSAKSGPLMMTGGCVGFADTFGRFGGAR